MNSHASRKKPREACRHVMREEQGAHRRPEDGGDEERRATQLRDGTHARRRVEPEEPEADRNAEAERPQSGEGPWIGKRLDEGPDNDSQ